MTTQGRNRPHSKAFSGILEFQCRNIEVNERRIKVLHKISGRKYQETIFIKANNNEKICHAHDHSSYTPTKQGGGTHEMNIGRTCQALNSACLKAKGQKVNMSYYLLHFVPSIELNKITVQEVWYKTHDLFDLKISGQCKSFKFR